MPFRNFSLFPNKYFVETGSYRGDGIQAALDAGFPDIRSIEISEKYLTHCFNRFKGVKGVSIYAGDSSERLYKIICDITDPITFWLDGHWSMEDTGRGQVDFPLLLELEQIKLHPIKTHTIIIDDVRLFEIQWNTSVPYVLNKLKEINPDYHFEFLDGYVKEDVLIAKPI